MVKLNTQLILRTANQDLGRTLLLAAWQLLEKQEGNGSVKKIIVQESSSNKDSLSVHYDSSQELCLTASDSFLHLPNELLKNIARKIEIRLKKSECDFTSVDHFQVVQRQMYLNECIREQVADLGPESACKVLLRIDDFPSNYAETKDFCEFHELTRKYKLPYLLAVTPFLEREEGPRSLTDNEVAILKQCQDEGVEFAVHGFTHERRNGELASELKGMPESELEEKILKAKEYFKSNELKEIGFVAPFNHYDSETISVLAKHFPFITGGPESTLSLGYRMGPSFLGDAVYVPSYRFAYDINDQNFEKFDQLLAEAKDCVIPITLHWHNLLKDGTQVFDRVLKSISEKAMSWKEYLSQVEKVRNLATEEN